MLGNQWSHSSVKGVKAMTNGDHPQDATRKGADKPQESAEKPAKAETSAK